MVETILGAGDRVVVNKTDYGSALMKPTSQ